MTGEHECKWYYACPIKLFYERGKIEKRWVVEYCRGNWKECRRYYLEEKRKPHSDWMLPDGSIDEKLKEV